MIKTSGYKIINKGCFSITATASNKEKRARQALFKIIWQQIVGHFPFLAPDVLRVMAEYFSCNTRLNIVNQSDKSWRVSLADFPVEGVVPYVAENSALDQGRIRDELWRLKRAVYGLQILSKGEFRDEAYKQIQKLGPGDQLYMASGDMDRIKHFNNIYGKPIVNALLRDIREVIRFEAERMFGRADEVILCFGGDEFYFLVKVSGESRGFNPQRAFDLVRQSVSQCLEKRRGVALLPTREEKEMNRLKQVVRDNCVVLEERRRLGGYLVLFRIPEGSEYSATLRSVDEKINAAQTNAANGPYLRLDPDWVVSQGGKRAFNGGYVLTPTVSIGVVSLADICRAKEMSWPLQERERTVELISGLTKKLFNCAEDALHSAKQARNTVRVGLAPRWHDHSQGVGALKSGLRQKYDDAQRALMSEVVSKGEYDLRDHLDLRLLSQEAFRALVSEQFRNGQRGMLICLEAVYSGGQEFLDYLKMLHESRRRDLRGWGESVGLRGINKLYGERCGDEVIIALSEALFAVLSPSRETAVSRFVDNFFLWVPEGSSALPQETLAMTADGIQRAANELLTGVRVDNLRVSCVITEGISQPGQLFQRLEDTILVEAPDQTISPAGNLIKMFSPAAAERAISVREEIVAASADELAAERQDRQRQAAAYQSIADHSMSEQRNSLLFTGAYDRLPFGSATGHFFTLARPALSSSPRILDIGAGTGKALEAYRDMPKGTVVLIDRNPAMLAVARKRQAASFPQLKADFICGNLTDLDKMTKDYDPFDVVIGRYILNYLQPLAAFLPQVQAAIRPGGRAIFNVFGGYFYGESPRFFETSPFYAELLKAMKEVLEQGLSGYQTRWLAPLIESEQVKIREDGRVEVIGPAITQNLSQELLQQAFTSAGFRNVEFYPVTEWFPFQAKMDFALLKNSLPFYWNITELISKSDTRLRRMIVEQVFSKLAHLLGTEIKETTVFVSAEK